MKLQFTVVMILMAFVTNVALAVAADAPDPDNVYLKQGDSAPYEGILFPLPRAERVHLMDIDLTTCTKVSSLKDDENTILTSRLSNANAEIDNLSKQVASSKESSMFTQVGMFILGAAAASLVAYGASRAVR